MNYTIKTPRLRCALTISKNTFHARLTDVPHFSQRHAPDVRKCAPVRVGVAIAKLESCEYYPGSKNPCTADGQKARLTISVMLKAGIAGKLVVQRFSIDNCSPVASLVKLQGIPNHVIKAVIQEVMEYVDKRVLPINRNTLDIRRTVVVSTAHLCMSDGLNIGKDKMYTIARSPDGVDVIVSPNFEFSKEDLVAAGYSDHFKHDVERILDACALAGAPVDWVMFGGDGPVLPGIPTYDDWV